MSNLRITERAKHPGTGSAFDATNIDNILVNILVHFTYPVHTMIQCILSNISTSLSHADESWQSSRITSKENRCISVFLQQKHTEDQPGSIQEERNWHGWDAGTFSNSILSVKSNHLFVTSLMTMLTDIRLPDQPKYFQQQKQLQLQAWIESQKPIDSWLSYLAQTLRTQNCEGQLTLQSPSFLNIHFSNYEMLITFSSIHYVFMKILWERGSSNSNRPRRCGQ